jgi:hypothetical protein
MSIQDFLVKLESGKERSSLFMALRRLHRLGDLRDLVLAATANGSNGWVSWQDSDAESVHGAAVAGA